MLTAFACVGRWVFALPILPNIQPMTTILILITLLMDTVDGTLVATLSILLTNMLLGTGPWTIHQILTYTILIFLLGFLRPLYRKESWRSRLFFMMISALFGFLFGLIISVFSVYTYQINNFWTYYLRGLPFDALHALGNVIFYIVLEPILAPLLTEKSGNE